MTRLQIQLCQSAAYLLTVNVENFAESMDPGFVGVQPVNVSVR